MQEPPPSSLNPLLFAVIVEGGIGLVAVALGAMLGHPPAETIEWTLHGAILGVAYTLPLVVLIWLCIRSGWSPIRNLLHLVDDVVTPWFRDCRIWEFAVIALFAGLGEEMLFRGVIQAAIAEQFVEPTGTAIGLIAASVLFGLLHWATATYAALAALIGLYLGGLWLATGNLLVPAVVHALYDFWALVYLVRYRNRTAAP
jgi:uncharacterized protein